jgi:cyanosortase A-associated protein
MSFLHRIRPALLAVASLVVLTAGAVSALTPVSHQAIYAPYQFPERWDLDGWLFESSAPLGVVGPLKSNNALIADRLYRYRGGLEIAVRYLVDSDGDTARYGRDFLPKTPAPTEVRSDPQRGSYALATDSGTAYLSACINPRGGSTVTATQFEANRRGLDLSPDRLVAWLFNRAYLLDHRCLWTRMTVPMESDRQFAYRTLERAWFAWYDRASLDFPQP